MPDAITYGQDCTLHCSYKSYTETTQSITQCCFPLLLHQLLKADQSLHCVSQLSFAFRDPSEGKKSPTGCVVSQPQWQHSAVCFSSSFGRGDMEMITMTADRAKLISELRHLHTQYAIYLFDVSFSEISSLIHSLGELFSPYASLITGTDSTL